MNGKYKEGWAILPKCTIVDKKKVEMYIAPQNLKLCTQIISRKSNVYTLQKLHIFTVGKKSPTRETKCFAPYLANWFIVWLVEQGIWEKEHAIL